MSKEITPGSGNVFKDLELAHPEERQLKARLAAFIGDVIEERGLTQQAAGAVLGVAQPDVSDLLRGRLRRFSVARLFRFITLLDHRIDIELSPAPDAREERITVHAHD